MYKKVTTNVNNICNINVKNPSPRHIMWYLFAFVVYCRQKTFPEMEKKLHVFLIFYSFFLIFFLTCSFLYFPLKKLLFLHVVAFFTFVADFYIGPM